MPRAAVRVQAASTRTHWTLGRADQLHDDEPLPLYSPQAAEVGSMQANGHYFDQQEPPLPSYESYDGSGYGSPVSSRASSAQYSSNAVQYSNKSLQPQTNGKYDDFEIVTAMEHPQQRGPQQPLVNGNHYDDYKYDHPPEGQQRGSHHISLNTRLLSEKQDVVGRHLLYETALLDTQSFEILDINEVDALKKEHGRLNQRIEAVNRKLALESKVKDAAQNLQRLYSSSKKDGRPDTPQSPESPRKGRNSLLGNRGRTGSGSNPGGQTLHQAEDELAQSIKKVGDLDQQIKSLLDRRQTVERKLLRHTAAVLAEQANQATERRTVAPTNGHRDLDDIAVPMNAPDEFEGIRDILRGLPAPSSKQDLQKIQDDHEQQLISMQGRLEQLNSQLRVVIAEASQTRGESPLPEPAVRHADDPKQRLENTLTIVESNMQALERERSDNKAHYAQVQDSAYLTRNAVEEQLEGLNVQLHSTLQISSEQEVVRDMRKPPEVTGHGYQHQLQYLEETLLTMEKLLNQHRDELDNAKETSGGASREIEEAHSRAASQAQRAAEYENVLAGLWDIVSADAPSGLTPRGSIDDSSARSGARSPLTPLKEDFSLQAFSSRVQHLFDAASGAREQQDILRRQIQQQRDLNGKSDMEKDLQLAELQTKYDKLMSSYDATQQDLAKAMAGHEQAEREANESRSEMTIFMNEFELLKKTVDDTQSRQKEVDQRRAQISAEKEGLQKEMGKLESEVVRLTTELTVAKADLEGAYGTRKERRKEAGVAAEEIDALQKLRDQEIEDLKKAHEQHIDTLRREQSDRQKLLEAELQDMTNEFQEMTRESLELEKERGQLEGLIDSLRERCDSLEQQLTDEKVRYMGARSPGGADGTAPREATSVMVLRQEFKKMMREARADGVRLIRAEQEERRKLESDLRKMRQEKGPLGRSLHGIHASNNSIGGSLTPIHSRYGSGGGANGLSPSTPTPTPSNSTLTPASAAAA